eukprot:snap_masked-scaffold_31-processed-gene-3.2-mRNA-1 protein AED:0.08 eAED:0.09 QI:0/0/0/1/1/1/2/0/702
MATALVGFSAIIYKDRFFIDNDYLPTLMKLFAVGQVQDAGLIFLSSMARKIVLNLSQHEGIENDDVVTTVIFALSGSTALLGILLIIVGKLQLANIVQYLPLPVIGGYLAYIGLLCGESGLRLMTDNENIEGLYGLLYLFDTHTFLLSLPGIIAGLSLFYISHKVRNNFALPILLFSFPCIFYFLIFISGSSLDSARGLGLINELANIPPFYEVFHYFDLSQRTIYFGAIFPAILPDFLAMFFVVACGSCLDVAAVQFEMGKPLDYNIELECVGASNLVSGLLGGYTGSYIFSQTIFVLRNGVSTKITSSVVVIFELLIFFFPVDLLGYIPRFFFGSLLLFVAYELLIDWLILSFFRLVNPEYILVWITFISICLTNLEVGMGIGIVFSSLHFSGKYAKKTEVKLRDAPLSTTIRSLSLENELSIVHRHKVLYLSLEGFQFFGSSQKVIEAIQGQIFKEDIETEEFEKEVSYVVLDCSQVISIDATAARGCFLTLVFLLAESGVELILSGLRPSLQDLLERHEVLRKQTEPHVDEDEKPCAKHFDNVEEATEYCLDLISKPYEARYRTIETTSLEARNFSALENEVLGKFFLEKCEILKLSPGNLIVEKGTIPEGVFFIIKGAVKILCEDVTLVKSISRNLLGVKELFLQQAATYSIQVTSVKGISNETIVAKLPGEILQSKDEEVRRNLLELYKYVLKNTP